MLYALGHELEIQGYRYSVIGSISYEDKGSGDKWDEYRLIGIERGEERWLSIDQGNDEYEMSLMVPRLDIPHGFRKVDSGVQLVVARHGEVDVDWHERARYEQYEDEAGIHTISIERWSDETEYSRGMYIQFSDIRDLGESEKSKSVMQMKRRSDNPFGIMFVGLVGGLLMLAMGKGQTGTETTTTNVSSYLSANPLEYVQEAKHDDDAGDVVVYRTQKDVAIAATDIITAIEGNVTSTQEDDDGRTVAILTPNEYVLVYEDAGEDGMGLGDDETAESVKAQTGSDGGAGSVEYELVSEDESTEVDDGGEGGDGQGTEASPVTPDPSASVEPGTEAGDGETAATGESDATTVTDGTATEEAEPGETAEEESASMPQDGKTLIQVSPRQYAYSTDRRPYHSRYRSYRWYRQFYRSKGYASDETKYGESTTSSYGSYTGPTSVDSPSSNSFEDYARSIRQDSLGSTSGTSGGTSYGK